MKVQLITNQPLASEASACCALRSVHMYSSCILDEGPVVHTDDAAEDGSAYYVTDTAALPDFRSSGRPNCST